MTKKSFIKCVLPCIFIAGFMFFIPNLTFSAQPGLDLHYDGVMTWTSDAENPFTGLSHWVKVVDYDGIADDGSSHTVTVTYPDGSTVKTLAFNYEMDANSAIYEMYDSDISQPINAGTYTGNYVYRVTEVPGGNWTEATDYLDVNTVNPPDENKFSHTIGCMESYRQRQPFFVFHAPHYYNSHNNGPSVPLYSVHGNTWRQAIPARRTLSPATHPLICIPPARFHDDRSYAPGRKMPE